MACPVNGTLLRTMPSFVTKLKELERLGEGSGSEDLKQLIMDLYQVGEAVAVSLDREVRLRLSLQDQSQATSVAFSLSLQKLVHMNKCCEELFNKLRQLEDSQMNRVKAVQKPEKEPQRHLIAQHSMPALVGPPPPSSTFPSQRGGAFHVLQEKVKQGMLTQSLPTPSAPPTSSTGPSSQPSRSPGFVARPVRKARSETDLRESDLEKTVKSLNVDNERLRQSEKGLRKTNASLQRKCKTLEKERDKAEDRLQVEQSNRDSLAKLRKRNEELESELKIICDTQVWKDRHQAVARDAIDAAAKRITLGIPQQTNAIPSRQAALAQASKSQEGTTMENASEQTAS